MPSATPVSATVRTAGQHRIRDHQRLTDHGPDHRPAPPTKPRRRDVSGRSHHTRSPEPTRTGRAAAGREGGQRGGQRNVGDQADAADQPAHDLALAANNNSSGSEAPRRSFPGVGLYAIWGWFGLTLAGP